MKILQTDGRARRGEFQTVHGTVQTPAFQNVATAGAIKGGLSALDLKENQCQVMLCNTYHLHVRPGDELIKRAGGLHRFTGWDGPILTDKAFRLNTTYITISIPKWSDFNQMRAIILFMASRFQSQNGLILTLMQ